MRGKNLLLTFDDGFASNRVAAEEVLEALGIRAVFFVVSDFVAIGDGEEARRFVASRIRPGTSTSETAKDLTNLGVEDLKALIARGHTIGAHTKTHARLSEIGDTDELSREIVDSANDLERRLGVPIQHFAYTFGDLASFSQRALSVARRRFRFVYSGLRGDNADGVSSGALRRDALTPEDSLPLVGALLEGGADFRYSRERKQLDRWNEAR